MGWKKRLIKERDELQSRIDRLSRSPELETGAA